MRRVVTAALAALILHSVVVVFIAQRVDARKRWGLLLTMDHPTMVLGNTQRAELAVRSCLVLGGFQAVLITLVFGTFIGTILEGRQYRRKVVLWMAGISVLLTFSLGTWLYYPAVFSALAATGMGAAIWLDKRRGAWTPLVMPGSAFVTHYFGICL